MTAVLPSAPALPDHLASGLQPLEQALFDRIGSVPSAARPASDVDIAEGDSRPPGRPWPRASLRPDTIGRHACARPAGPVECGSRAAGSRAGVRMKDGSGRPIAGSAEELAQKIVDRLTRQSADVILAACLAEDGVGDLDPAKSMSIDRALQSRAGHRPLCRCRSIGRWSASALPRLSIIPPSPRCWRAKAPFPPMPDVANAIGAVVGQVRASARCSSPCRKMASSSC